MFSTLLKDPAKRKRTLEIKKEKVVSMAVSNGSKAPGKLPCRETHVSSRLSGPALAGRTKSTSRQVVNTHRKRSASSTVDFGGKSSESESEFALAITTKKIRTRDKQTSFQRSVRYLVRPEDADNTPNAIVHAASIPSLDQSTKYEPCFEGSQRHDVELQYPSLWPKERYSLVRPTYDDSAFNAIDEIIAVMRTVSQYFVPRQLRSDFDEDSDGFPQQLKRATRRRSFAEIFNVIQCYNDRVRKLLESDMLGEQLGQNARVPPGLVEQLLNQTYSRTVSPNLESLRKYEAGTDNVYGELLPRFVSDILTKDVDMRPGEVFVDLGSGVGNVVLQAALEIGCESWGCEVTEASCDLADRQLADFKARCNLWGLSVGNVHLERGDFLLNDTIKGVLKRADMVLVNNQVFTPALNEALTTLFLDLKDGCQVVSLKSFVPSGYRITERNSGNPLNMLRVQAKTYFSNCVSWTSQGGSYFVAEKDSSRFQKLRRHAREHVLSE